MPADPFNLERFVKAQDFHYENFVAELSAGRKRTHWMWFVFPQLEGLGSSAMSEKYAIADLEEAQAYLTHPVLGERLQLCTNLVLTHEGLSAHAIFGSPDDMKFHSSMTLFDAAAPGGLWDKALKTFFDGERDSRTLELLL